MAGKREEREYLVAILYSTTSYLLWNYSLLFYKFSYLMEYFQAIQKWLWYFWKVMTGALSSWVYLGSSMGLMWTLHFSLETTPPLSLFRLHVWVWMAHRDNTPKQEITFNVPYLCFYTFVMSVWPDELPAMALEGDRTGMAASESQLAAVDMVLTSYSIFFITVLIHTLTWKSVICYARVESN